MEFSRFSQFSEHIKTLDTFSATSIAPIIKRVEAIIENNGESLNDLVIAKVYQTSDFLLTGFTVWTKALIIECRDIPGSSTPFFLFSLWRDPAKLELGQPRREYEKPIKKRA